MGPPLQADLSKASGTAPDDPSEFIRRHIAHLEHASFAFNTDGPLRAEHGEFEGVVVFIPSSDSLCHLPRSRVDDAPARLATIAYRCRRFPRRWSSQGQPPYFLQHPNNSSRRELFYTRLDHRHSLASTVYSNQPLPRRCRTIFILSATAFFFSHSNELTQSLIRLSPHHLERHSPPFLKSPYRLCDYITLSNLSEWSSGGLVAVVFSVTSQYRFTYCASPDRDAFLYSSDFVHVICSSFYTIARIV